MKLPVVIPPFVALITSVFLTFGLIGKSIAIEFSDDQSYQLYDVGGDGRLDVVITQKSLALIKHKRIDIPLLINQDPVVAEDLTKISFGVSVKEARDVSLPRNHQATIDPTDYQFLDFNQDGYQDVWVKVSKLRSVIVYGEEVHQTPPTVIDFTGKVDESLVNDVILQIEDSGLKSFEALDSSGSILGLAQSVHLGNGDYDVAFSIEEELEAPEERFPTVAGLSDANKVVGVDFDGDGVEDYVILPRLRHIPINVLDAVIVTQSSFTVAYGGSDMGLVTEVSKDWGRLDSLDLSKVYDTSVGDFNGDAQSDLVIINDGKVVTFRAEDEVVISATVLDFGSGLSSLSGLSVLLQDTNGDNNKDVVVMQDGAIVGIGEQSNGHWHTRNYDYPSYDVSLLAGKMPGEFSVSQMGAATYNIPIELPPGPDGLTPSISVAYSSMSGQGILGRGWSLAAGDSIAPCAKTVAQDGAAVALPEKWWESEYCWNGERLRPRTPGSDLKSGTAFYTESESFVDISVNGNGHGSGSWTRFNVIHSDGSEKNFNSSYNGVFNLGWHSDIYRNNIGYSYMDEDVQGSRIPYPRIEEIKVRRQGNIEVYRVVFQYADRPDHYEGYPFPKLRQTTEQRLDKIRILSGSTTLYEYRFGYLESGTAYTESYLASVQRCFPGQGSSGSEVAPCLAPIQFSYQENNSASNAIAHHQTSQQTLSGNTVRSLSSGSPMKRHIAKFQNSHIAGNFNSDALTDYITFTDTDEYIIWLADGSGGFQTEVRTTQSENYPHYFSMPGFDDKNFIYLPGDHDGDGDTDLVHLINNHFLVVWLSNGDGTFTIKSRFPATDGWEVANGGIHTAHYRYQVGEFNGDGRADLIHWREEGARVWLSNGDGTFNIQPYYRPSPVYDIGANNTHYKVADFNGDGLSDLAHISATDKMYIWLNKSNGSEFVVTDNVLPYSDVSYDLGGNQQYKLAIGDFNGDGKHDIFHPYDDNTANVMISKGDGTFERQTVPRPTSRGFSSDSNYLYQAMDINADGISDLVNPTGWNLDIWYGQPNGIPKYHGSMLTNLNNQVTLNINDLYNHSVVSSGPLGWFLRDVPSMMQGGALNGDGLVDLTFFTYDYTTAPDLGSDDVYISTNSVNATTLLLQAPKPSRLSQIVDGYGNETLIDYENLAQSRYSVTSLPAAEDYPDLLLVSPAYEAVATVRTSDSVGSYGISQYYYSDMRANLQGLGMLGFAKVDQLSGAGWTPSFDPINSGEFSHVETIYNVSSADRKYGSPRQIKQYHKKRSGGVETHSQILSDITYTHTDVFPNDPKRFFHYVSDQKARSWDLNGVETTRVNTTNTVNEFGTTTNSTTITHDVQAAKQHRTTTITEISSPSGYGCYGRPTLFRLPSLTTVEKETYHQTPPYQPKVERRKTEVIYDDHCRVYQRIKEPDDSELRLTTEYTYHDSLVTGQTVTGHEVSNITETQHYDSLDRLQWRENALGHRETFSYGNNRLYWLPTRITDPNGLSTTQVHDPLGRVLRETYADGTEQHTVYGRCDQGIVDGVSSNHCNANGPVKEFVYSRKTGETPTVAYLDALGRQLRVTSQLYSNGAVRTVEQFFEFNADGEASKASKPRFENSGAIVWENTTYDFNHRPVQVDHFDLTTTKYAFNGLETLVTNAKNQTTKTRELAWGGKLWTEDANGQRVEFTYDAFGNLVQTKDPAGNLIRNKFDVRGRKVLMHDPDLGAWTYTYDGLSRLKTQTDAKGQTTVMAYDKLGRLATRTDADGSVSTWLYERASDSGTRAIGKLSREFTSDFTKVYHYDDLGRPDKVTTYVLAGEGKGTYESGLEYDRLSRVTRKIYPNNGLVLKYEYDSDTSEHIRTVDAKTGMPYWTFTERNALGNTTLQRLGTNIDNRFSYNWRTDRLERIEGIVHGVTDHSN